MNKLINALNAFPINNRFEKFVVDEALLFTKMHRMPTDLKEICKYFDHESGMAYVSTDTTLYNVEYSDAYTAVGKFIEKYYDELPV